MKIKKTLTQSKNVNNNYFIVIESHLSNRQATTSYEEIFYNHKKILITETTIASKYNQYSDTNIAIMHPILPKHNKPYRYLIARHSRSPTVETTPVPPNQTLGVLCFPLSPPSRKGATQEPDID